MYINQMTKPMCVCVVICLYVGPWTVESFPYMLWRWRNKLKWAPFEFFAPSPLLRVRSWLHPFQGHCEQKAMRDEGVIYVAGHPLLNRRCTRLPGVFASEMTCIVSSGALNSTHSLHVCGVFSDVMCGRLWCDTSAIANPQIVNFQTDFTLGSNCVSGTVIFCRARSYITFYNGPYRQDPGLVPNGAVCGTGKVTQLKFGTNVNFYLENWITVYVKLQ